MVSIARRADWQGVRVTDPRGHGRPSALRPGLSFAKTACSTTASKPLVASTSRRILYETIDLRRPAIAPSSLRLDSRSTPSIMRTRYRNNSAACD